MRPSRKFYLLRKLVRNAKWCSKSNLPLSHSPDCKLFPFKKGFKESKLTDVKNFAFWHFWSNFWSRISLFWNNFKKNTWKIWFLRILETCAILLHSTTLALSVRTNLKCTSDQHPMPITVKIRKSFNFIQFWNNESTLYLTIATLSLSFSAAANAPRALPATASAGVAARQCTVSCIYIFHILVFFREILQV